MAAMKYDLPELGAPNVAVLIDDNTGNTLASAPRHDPCLRGVEGETLLTKNGLDRVMKTSQRLREIRVAREREIIGISRVIRSSRASQTMQPAIDCPGKKVRERR